MPDRHGGPGPFYRDVIAADPLDPWGAASAAHRLGVLAPALPFPVGDARPVPSNNNDVWRLEAGYLRVAWRGDRGRLAREAELLSRLRGSVPVPEVLGCGAADRLAWSLTAAVPGTPLADRCSGPGHAGLRGLAREAAGLLRTLHSWPVPADLAPMLHLPAAGTSPLRRAGSELVLLPPSSALGLIPAARQLPFVDHGVLDAAAARLKELGSLAGTGAVLLHGDFYLGNVLVHGGHVSALIDFEFSRTGPRDLELISVVRALDAETRLGIPRPPLLAWLAHDYPELFSAPDLERRLWLYALAYTIRHILFWPPDRAEADGLDAAHPVRTLRRLADAPLPFPAWNLPAPWCRRQARPASRKAAQESPGESVGSGRWCS